MSLCFLFLSFRGGDWWGEFSFFYMRPPSTSWSQELALCSSSTRSLEDLYIVKINGDMRCSIPQFSTHNYYFYLLLSSFFGKMAYTCFKCKRQISRGIKTLFMNLRAIHYVNSASTHFQGSESGCGRTFSCMWSFKRQLEKEHEVGNTLDDPFEGPAPPVDVENVEMLSAEMEPAQGDEEVEEEWDELEPGGITNRVALFLAQLRSKSSMTYSNLNFVVQHTSSLISDIVSSQQSKTVGSILTIWKASIKRKTQVALWADLRRCCYYAGGINYSCAWRKSKMGWS